MRINPTPVLFSIVIGLSSFAADAPPPADPNQGTPVSSKITVVTVYADRAQVTRVASIQPPADTTRLAFEKLPGWLDEGSVRVSISPADAAQLLDVQVRRSYLARASDEEFQKAEAAVREISDQIAALDDERGVLDAESKQIDSIRMFSLEKLPKDVAAREIKPEEYGASVKFIAASLRDIAQSKRDLEKKRRDLQPELSARQRKLDDLRQRAQLEQRAVIVTLKGNARPATLSLTYMLPGATWQPAHELRATANGKAVTLGSYAIVMQTTGEDWVDVALTLSTQRSTETMKIPELEALFVDGRKLSRLTAGARDTFLEANKNWEIQNSLWFNMANPDALAQQEYGRNQRIQIANTKSVEVIFEKLHERGTTAHFPGLAPQIVRTDGRQVRVPIGNAELAAVRRILAAPELSLNAASLVDLSNTSKQPLLPGRVGLYVGGAFLGLTETDFVAPGEGFSLYLGVADSLKLSRTLDKKRSALIRGGSKTRMQVSFLVGVENLSDAPAALQLTERIPVSESDEVRVSSVKIQPEGKPDNKGLLRWDLTLGPRQIKEYHIDYTLEYPNVFLEEARKAPSSSMGPPMDSSSLQYRILRLEKQMK